MKKKLPIVVIAVLIGGFILRELVKAPRLEAAMLRLEVRQKNALLDPGFRSFIEQYESYLSSRLGEEGVPGAAVAIVKDSTVALLRGYGLRSVNAPDSVDERTVFRLASLSKGFTGILAGLLVKKGELSWDEPIHEHLPDFRLRSEEHTRALRLHHLLSHSTGLPRHTYSNLLNMGMAYPAILEKLSGVHLSHPVGAYHNYQNVAFSLSGDLMLSATGRDFPSLLNKYIFEPLHMEDASADYDSMRLGDNIALPHSRRRSGFSAVEIEPNYYEVRPAAGVNASISDMANYLQLLLGNRPDILPDSLLGQVFQPHIEIPLNDRILRNWDGLEWAHYAMGWRVLQKPDIQIIQHSGYVNGYRAEIAFCREDKIGIVLLTNAPNYTVGQAIPAFFEQYEDFRQRP